MKHEMTSKQHHQVKTSSIPYSTTIDGATPFVQSYLKLSNENVSNFKQLNQKVKSTLKQDYKISATQIEKSKTAQYTVTWKNGKKQTISLKMMQDYQRKSLMSKIFSKLIS